VCTCVCVYMYVCVCVYARARVHVHYYYILSLLYFFSLIISCTVILSLSNCSLHLSVAFFQIHYFT